MYQFLIFVTFLTNYIEFYLRLNWETDKLIALPLTLVPMLNLTAVVFTSVLGIAGKPLYIVTCVINVYEQSVSVRVTKK